MSSMTQREMVLYHLERLGTISTWEAMKEYGIADLQGVICRLRQNDYKITDKWEHGVNRFGKRVSWKKYKLERE